MDALRHVSVGGGGTKSPPPALGKGSTPTFQSKNLQEGKNASSVKYKASASSMWAFAGTSSVTQSKSREINTCGFETAKSLLCMHMCVITRPRKTLRCFFF